MGIISEKIFEIYQKQEQNFRPHLGASEIGTKCPRKPWLNFRWYQKQNFEPRIKRIFDTGLKAEDRFNHELEKIGIEIVERNIQAPYFEELQGHFSGSADALIRNVPGHNSEKIFIAEFKTHNKSSFNKLVKYGLLEGHYQHFAQIQVYMGLFGIHQAIYLAENKDNSDLYDEFVDFDEEAFKAFTKSAKSKILDPIMPLPISNKKEYYVCRMCNFKEFCHGSQKPDKNCRTCKFSHPAKDGAWKCKKFNIPLDYKQQIQGCENYEQKDVNFGTE